MLLLILLAIIPPAPPVRNCPPQAPPVRAEPADKPVTVPLTLSPVYAPPVCVGGNCPQQQQSYAPAPWRPFQRFR